MAMSDRAMFTFATKGITIEALNGMLMSQLSCETRQGVFITRLHPVRRHSAGTTY